MRKAPRGADPEHLRLAALRKRAETGKRQFKRRELRGGVTGRLGRRYDPLLRRLSQELQRVVELLRPHPADALVARHGAQFALNAGDGVADVLPQGDGEEQAHFSPSPLPTALRITPDSTSPARRGRRFPDRE